MSGPWSCVDRYEWIVSSCSSRGRQDREQPGWVPAAQRPPRSPAASDIWFAFEIDVSVARGDDHLSVGAQRAFGIKERGVEDLAEEELLTEVDDAAGYLPGD